MGVCGWLCSTIFLHGKKRSSSAQATKTEILVGYGTAAWRSLQVLSIHWWSYKSQICSLLKQLEVRNQWSRKAPSADLWEGQTDEKEMGVTYAKLDALLYEMIDERHSDEELVKMGIWPVAHQKDSGSDSKNQFKRRPPGDRQKFPTAPFNVDFPLCERLGNIKCRVPFSTVLFT